MKISLPSEDGDEAILVRLARGDVFGELALLDGAPRSATATALTAVETVVLPRDRFRELIANEPVVRDALLGVARRRAPAPDDARRGAALPRHHRPPGRLPRPARHDGGTALPDGAIRLRTSLTQGDLASMVGSTRQSVNKLLRQFTDDGYLRLERDAIVVTDLEGLARASRR